MKPESKFYKEIKRNWKGFSYTRIENSVSLGTPDLLVYNENHFFFTLELKVALSNKVRFSPHQIAFHKRHPLNSFIIVKALKENTVKLYEGQQVEALVSDGLKLEPLATDLEACGLLLGELGGWAQLDA
tara:strand:- start:920 stop:1306 length:387 start_codon:yes stop_codon:yes gene_type:complete